MYNIYIVSLDLLSPAIRDGRGSPVGSSRTVAYRSIGSCTKKIIVPRGLHPGTGHARDGLLFFLFFFFTSAASLVSYLWHVSEVEAAGAAVATCPENLDGALRRE